MTRVLKFGGTSMGGADNIKNVANIIKNYKQNGDNVVAVVSAMGGETNKLISLANSISKDPIALEMDTLLSSGERVSSSLLSICLNDMGIKAISLSGRQAGITTDDNHNKAKIDKINSSNLQQYIKDGYTAIVAGFQGFANNRVTTLGRGGSDLTAVAIAGSIQADVCEIYTDVQGIYTADPRVVPNAKKLEQISYDEMLELSSLGAKVLQSRSVELAKKLDVKLISRSSFEPNTTGTTITKEENIVEQPIVSGIATDDDQVRVGIYKVIDRPGIAGQIFSKLAFAGINVDMIVQTVGTDGTTDLDFTVPTASINETKKCMKKFEHECKYIDYNEKISKVSVVGLGMKSHTGVAADAFMALANNNINIRIISTSEIKISMIIDKDKSKRAVQALHDIYKLDQ
ncbi:MAG: aspartate kinase [Campylobacteraceae bacterium 4484_166]|nr:MAG: aspartate kinase [Campylobacteraceae bacterium 4484_166]